MKKRSSDEFLTASKQLSLVVVALLTNCPQTVWRGQILPICDMLTLCSHFATCYLRDKAFMLHWIKAFFTKEAKRNSFKLLLQHVPGCLEENEICLFLHMFVCIHTHIQGHAPYRTGLVNRCSIGLQEVPTELCTGLFNSHIHMQALILDVQTSSSLFNHKVEELLYL